MNVGRSAPKIQVVASVDSPGSSSVISIRVTDQVTVNDPLASEIVISSRVVDPFMTPPTKVGAVARSLQVKTVSGPVAGPAARLTTIAAFATVAAECFLPLAERPRSQKEVQFGPTLASTGDFASLRACVFVCSSESLPSGFFSHRPPTPRTDPMSSSSSVTI
jgi:hypothetical protein